MKKTSIKERLFRLLAYLLILVLLIVTVYPFIWMILNSFKSNAEIFQTPLALPKSWDLSVFKKAWTNYNLGHAYANSLKITACVVLINLAVSSLAAYATSTLHFAGRKELSAFLHRLPGRVRSGAADAAVQAAGSIPPCTARIWV